MRVYIVIALAKPMSPNKRFHATDQPRFARLATREPRR